MCLSLEHQNLSKTSEKMGYFDCVTVSLHILYTANEETEGSRDRLTASVALLHTFCASARIWLAVIDFQNWNNKVDLGQIRREEIVYSRFIKMPLG